MTLTKRQRDLYDAARAGSLPAADKLLHTLTTPTSSTRAAHARLLREYQTKYGNTVRETLTDLHSWIAVEDSWCPGVTRYVRRITP